MLPARPLLLAAAVLLLAAPVSAELTKGQQACVNTDNASWQKIAGVFGKSLLGCIATHNKGALTSTVEGCITESSGTKIGKAIDKSLAAFDARCLGLDGGGQPKQPSVFVVDAMRPALASYVEVFRSLTAIYGADVEAAAVTSSENKSVAACQSAVAKSLGKCATLRRKSFNGCKKSALAVGKEPFPAGATTTAELATCFSYDPKGGIAKTCDGTGDKIRQTIAKQCVGKDVDLTVAFPQCGVGDVDGVHGCVAAPTTCAVCQAVNGVDALGLDCDLLDDGASNGSCVPLEVLVPAYANPCCGDGPAMWTSLETAAQAGTVRLNVILNPASGPGAGPQIDPNYVNTGPVGPLLDVRAAGAKIYGYVSTSFATRPIGDAKADIDLYYTLAYWRGAGIELDGVFLDEMSSDLPDVGYYQELRDYVKAKDAAARVIANPGQPFIQDTSAGASGFTIADYATAADVLVTFEGTGTDYLFNYDHPPWVHTLPATHFAHLIHGVANEGEMQGDVYLARLRKAGMLYVTDDVFSPNPWDALATYWTTELDALAIP